MIEMGDALCTCSESYLKCIILERQDFRAWCSSLSFPACIFLTLVILESVSLINMMPSCPISPAKGGRKIGQLLATAPLYLSSKGFVS